MRLHDEQTKCAKEKWYNYTSILTSNFFVDSERHFIIILIIQLTDKEVWRHQTPLSQTELDSKKHQNTNNYHTVTIKLEAGDTGQISNDEEIFGMQKIKPLKIWFSLTISTLSSRKMSWVCGKWPRCDCAIGSLSLPPRTQAAGHTTASCSRGRFRSICASAWTTARPSGYRWYGRSSPRIAGPRTLRCCWRSELPCWLGSLRWSRCSVHCTQASGTACAATAGSPRLCF